MTEIAAVLDVARDVTLTGLLVLILWGGYKEVWVWGKRAARDLAAEREEKLFWRSRTLALMGVTETSVKIAERATGAE